MKKWLIPFLLAGVLFALSACARQEAELLWDKLPEEPALTEDAGMDILMSYSKTEGSLAHQLALQFQADVQRQSDGTMRVHVFPGDTLGSGVGGSEALLDGTVELRIGRSSTPVEEVISWLPLLTDVDLDWVCEQMKEGGALFEILQKSYQDQNLIPLCVLQPEFRVMTANRPIAELADFSGLKMRLYREGMEKTFWSMLGAQPQMLDFEALYPALQQGMVEAQENTLQTICDSRLYDYQDYVVQTNFVIEMSTLYVSRMFYEGLTPEEQGWLKDAASRMAENYASALEEERRQYYELLEKEGVQVIPLSPAFRAQIRELAGGYIQQTLSERCGQDQVDRVVRACVS